MDITAIIDRALEQEKLHKDDPNWLGFEWNDVQARKQDLNMLVADGLLDISYHSHAFTHYRLTKDTNKIIAALSLNANEEQEIPIDLFDIIEGADSTKRLISMALYAVKPVHVLLYGAFATAKTMFLSELARLPNARYALGGTSTRAGVVDYVLQTRPRYLIIDELDKMDMRDFSALLSLMETGTVSRLKHHANEIEHLTCWVFAGANNINRIPVELRSRFLKVEMTTYTDEEYEGVVKAVLVRRENIDPELSSYIARSLIGKSNDVRDAVRIARMATSVKAVDDLIKVIFA